MTGYDPSELEPAGRTPPRQQGGPGDHGGDTERPGPLPPRIEPTWITQPSGPPAGRPVSAAPSPGMAGPPSPGMAGPSGPGVAGPSGPGAAAPSGPGAGAPPGAAPGSGGGSGAGPGAVGGSWAYTPSSGYPIPYSPPPPGYQEPVAAAVGAPRRRLAWPGILALLLVLALGGVVAFQARQIERLDAEVGRAHARAERLEQGQASEDARLDAVEGRAGELEKRAGEVFDPEAIASSVVPSVFRVTAGNVTGTAFAVGKPAAGGGANLFTNFHVVEAVWNGGGREVRLERRGESHPARIARVDQRHDVAHLTTTSRFAGLVTAPAAVRSGQQIVVVGAPLGLEDSVTTGVVSAFRSLEDGTGTVIQFSAPINPGNSGGPVVNADKQVVGIATAKARDAEGIGLAVPIKTACDEFRIC